MRSGSDDANAISGLVTALAEQLREGRAAELLERLTPAERQVLAEVLTKLVGPQRSSGPSSAAM